MVEFLRSRGKELQGALDAVERAKAAKGKSDKALEKAKGAQRQRIDVAEAIATNPVIRKRIDAAKNITSDMMNMIKP